MQTAFCGGRHTCALAHAAPTGAAIPASIGGIPPSFGPPTHAPAWHTFPIGHCWQVAPPVPQAKRDCIITHWFWKQQPLAQVAASHTDVAQAPLTQLWPIGHIEHAAPDLPHANRFWLVGVTQTLLVQQPPHVVGLHIPTTHAPLTHCSPKLHIVQVPPALPHASAESPT